jgi:cobalt-zinc-cadmium resistance protein CzcA
VRVKREMDQIAGVADLGIFRVLGQPNLNIRVDRNRAARYGLNTGDVTAVVQAALGGAVATTQLEADRQFNVAVRLAPEYRGTIDSVARIKVAYTTPSGINAYIPLSEVATISVDTGASYIFAGKRRSFTIVPPDAGPSPGCWGS